ATAEISRAQLWQWVRNEAPLHGGGTATRARYQDFRDEELAGLHSETGRYRQATEILDALVLGEQFEEFLTFRAYEYLD
ncbi:MAG TPA: malate synthase A, partial [Herpetosiphonaceae bacterium]|nr:malate synthase A [Herpetosiphonaceae bacterium]